MSGRLATSDSGYARQALMSEYEVAGIVGAKLEVSCSLWSGWLEWGSIRLARGLARGRKSMGAGEREGRCRSPSRLPRPTIFWMRAPCGGEDGQL